MNYASRMNYAPETKAPLYFPFFPPFLPVLLSGRSLGESKESEWVLNAFQIILYAQYLSFNVSLIPPNMYSTMDMGMKASHGTVAGSVHGANLPLPTNSLPGASPGLVERPTWCASAWKSKQAIPLSSDSYQSWYIYVPTCAGDSISLASFTTPRHEI